VCREDVSIPWLSELLSEVIEPLSSGVPQYWKGAWRQPFQESAWVKRSFGITDLDSNRTFYKRVLWSKVTQDICSYGDNPVKQSTAWVTGLTTVFMVMSDLQRLFFKELCKMGAL